MPIAHNYETGETLFQDSDGGWKPARTAINPETKATVAWDGTDWKPVKTERSMLERMGGAAADTFKAGLGHAKDLFTAPEAVSTKLPESWEEAGEQAKEGAIGALKGLGQTALGVVSPLTMTLGAATSGLVAAPAASALGYGERKLREATGAKPVTSEQAYEAWRGPAELAAGFIPIPGKVPIPTSLRGVGRDETAAARIIEESSLDPTKVRTALTSGTREIVPGSKPSLAQLTEDPGLGALERAVTLRGNAPQVQLQREEQNLARTRALEGVQPGGSPQDAATAVRNELNVTNAANDQAVARAEQQAFQAQQRLGPEYDATVIGERMRAGIEAAEAPVRAREAALWRAVNPDGTLVADPASIQGVERGIYSPARMTETARAGVTPAETQISGLIQQYGRYIPFQELTDLRSLISTAMRNERIANGANSASFRRLLELRQGVEDALVTSVASVQPAGVARGAAAIGAPERVRAASAATRERAETFNPLRPITRGEMAGRPQMGPSSVPKQVVKAGPEGYDRTQNYLRAVGEGGMQDVQDEVVRLMRQKGVVNAEGGVDPKKLDTFMRQHGDVLRAITERDGGAFAQSLRNAATAQEGVVTAQAAREAAAARYGSDEIKKLLGVVDDADVGRAIGSIFGQYDSVDRARNLMRALPTPQAREGAKRAVLEWMQSRLISNAPTTVGPPMIAADKFQTFVQRNQQALSQFFDPAQMETLNKIALDIRRMNLSVASKVRGGSNTAQDLYNMQQQASRTMEIIGKLGGNALGHVLAHKVPGASKYVVSPIIDIVGGLRATGREKYVGRVQDIVDKAMLDPDYAAQLLRDLDAMPSPMRLPLQVPYAASRVGAAEGAYERRGKQSPARQAGGGVPAIGGTGGRSPGAREIVRARQARPGSAQALQDGGEARQQEAGQSVGSREKFGAALSSAGPFGGPFGGGGEMTGGTFKGKGKAPEPLTRQKVVDTLKQHGIVDPEVLKGWTEGWPHTAESRAQGGSVEDLPIPDSGYTDVAAKMPVDLGVSKEEDDRPSFRDWNKRRLDPGEYRRLPPAFTQPEMTPEDVERSEGWRGPTGRRFLQDGGGTDVPLPPVPPPVQIDPTPPPPTPDAVSDVIAGTMGGITGMPGTPDEDQRRRQNAPGGIAGVAGMYADGGDVEPMKGIAQIAAEDEDRGVTPEPVIFGGRAAKTANLALLKEAERMHALGEPSRRIWNQTGWFRGADGKWRYEISDQPAKLMPLGEEQLAKSKTIFPTGQAGGGPAVTTERFGLLPELVEHPEYFKAYPEMKSAAGEVFLDPRAPGRRGFFDVKVGQTPPFLHAEGSDADMALNTLLHEMQHGVQYIEGFTPGSSPMRAAKLIGPTRQRALASEIARQRGLSYNDLGPFEQKKFNDAAALRAYGKVAGEVEPRNVQLRWEKGITRLPPWQTEDIPREFQLVPTGQSRKPFLPGEPLVGEPPWQPFADGGEVEGPDEAQQSQEARERAATRQAQAVRPRTVTQTGRREEFDDPLAGARMLFDPSSPMDWAMLPLGVAGRFVRPAAKAAALGIGALAESTGEAEAGKLGAVKKLVAREAKNPGIYKDPRQIVEEARAKLAPEHPALKELFGVTRGDLYDISQQGRRPGNLPDPPWVAQPPGFRGSAAAEGVMTPQTSQRVIDTLAEAQKYPELIHGMDAWYVMDPAYQRLEYMHGPELAKRLYNRSNTMGAMASPASDVETELIRGSAANMAAHQGTFPTWQRWAGVAQQDRPLFGRHPIQSASEIPPGRPPYLQTLVGQSFPSYLAEVPGHLAHRTAHAPPMEGFLGRGAVDMGSAKVPVYIPASGVPETGFQTRWMVPDAHISKSLGMADVRTPGIVRQGASMSMPEYRQIGPWYREQIAEPLGIEAVPTQARQWSIYAPQTGVRSLIGAPKLELMAQRIWERALRRGWKPEVLRDYVLSGGAHMREGGTIQ